MNMLIDVILDAIGLLAIVVIVGGLLVIF